MHRNQADGRKKVNKLIPVVSSLDYHCQHPNLRHLRQRPSGILGHWSSCRIRL